MTLVQSRYEQEGAEIMAMIIQAFGPSPSRQGCRCRRYRSPVGQARNAPAGVQIVAGRFMDERCLAAARVMEGKIGPIAPIDPVTG